MTPRNVELPWFCLTCGYGEIPGEDFNSHECDEFGALPKDQQRANAKAHKAEIQRRLNRAEVPG